MKRKLYKAITEVFGGKYRWYFYIISIAAIGSLGVITFGSIAPTDFPSGTTVNIAEGMTVSQAANLLAKKGLIKSELLYKIYVVLLHEGYGIRSGHYLFEKPESSLRIAYRTAYDIEDLNKIKVTVPEGLASSDMARLIAKNLCSAVATTTCSFSQKSFLAIAKPDEGYLFPDTYFFYSNATAQEVFDMMSANFTTRTNGLGVSVALSGRTWSDIVKMASLLEEEASSSTDRRTIAGILWKRLDSGMALQVDAPFFYILGKTSAQLTLTDLATTSPYNLYRNKGLPPSPIDNPGLDAITDALNPIKTEYWYYLADKNGVTHYSATFGGQDINKVKYVN